MNAEDIDALDGHPSDRWLAHKGARLMGKWLIGEDPVELREPSHRTALAMRLFGRDAMKVMALRQKTP